MDHADCVAFLDTPIVHERTTTTLGRAGEALPAVAREVIAAIVMNLLSETESKV
jgi:hypothetical protein